MKHYALYSKHEVACAMLTRVFNVKEGKANQNNKTISLTKAKLIFPADIFLLIICFSANGDK